MRLVALFALLPLCAALVTETLTVPINGCDVRVIHLPPKGQLGAKGAPVVYLQHGLLDSTDTWVANGDDALAPILQKTGYDVWMADSRGNQFSPCPSAPKLTWDDLANDLKPVLAFVLTTSGAAKLTYIGHSQGAAILYAALSTGAVDPAMLNLFISLGAPVFMAEQRSPILGALATLHTDIIIKRLPLSIFDKGIDTLRAALAAISHMPLSTNKALFQGLFGDATCITHEGSNWQKHFPAVTTPSNLAHWVQAARSGNFQYFETGMFPTARKYKLEAIPKSVKIAAYYGTEDAVATEKDHNKLFELLGDRFVHKEAIQGYAHLDFTYCYSAKTDVYPKILEDLKTYAPLTTTTKNTYKK